MDFMDLMDQFFLGLGGIVRSRMVNLSRKKLDMLATRYPDFTGQYCIQKDNDVTCKNGEVRKLVDVIRVYR